MPFMLRSGEDDFETLLALGAIEASGAVVVAITLNGTATHQGAGESHQRFQIWARVENATDIDRIDEAIGKALEALNAKETA